MQNALIFSPNFDGHRQVYVFVLVHILTKMGFKVFIAGNFSRNPINTFYIDKLKNDDKFVKIDTSKYDGNGMDISNSDFFDLQGKYEIDLTIFTEADYHISLLSSDTSLESSTPR